MIRRSEFTPTLGTQSLKRLESTSHWPQKTTEGVRIGNIVITKVGEYFFLSNVPDRFQKINYAKSGIVIASLIKIHDLKNPDRILEADHRIASYKTQIFQLEQIKPYNLKYSISRDRIQDLSYRLKPLQKIIDDEYDVIMTRLISI